MRDVLNGARRPLAGFLFAGMGACASAAGSQLPTRSQDVVSVSPKPALPAGGLEHWRRVSPPAPAAPSDDGQGPRVQVHTYYTSVSGSRRVEPSFTADEDAYVVVAHLDAYGRVLVVFPASPREDGFVRRGQSYRVPPFFAGFTSEYAARRRDVLTWRSTTSRHDSYDGGTAYLFVIASRRPLQVDSIADNARWAGYELDETYVRDPRSAIGELATVLADGQEYSITYASQYASDRYSVYGGDALYEGFDSFAYDGYSSGLCSSGLGGFGFQRFGFAFGRPYWGSSFGYGSPYYAQPYYYGHSFYSGFGFGHSFYSGFGNCGFGYPGAGFAFGWGFAPRAPIFYVPRGRGGLHWPVRPGPFGFPLGPSGVPSRRPTVTVAGAGGAGGPGLAKRYPGVEPIAPTDPRPRSAPAYSPADVRPPRAQGGQDSPTVFRNAPTHRHSYPYAGIAPLQQPHRLEPQLIEPRVVEPRIVEPRLEAAPRQVTHGGYGPSPAAAPRSQPAPVRVMSSPHAAPSHAASAGGATSHGGGGGGRHPH